MHYIVIMELRGFAEISESLSRELERIDVSSADVRSSIISILSGIIDQIKENGENATPQFSNLLGGDTWGFVFDDFNNSLNFCCKILATLYKNLHIKGLFFIKPAISISCIQKISIKDEKLLDDGYINAYKLADKGHSYTLYFHESLFDDSSAKQYCNGEYIKNENGRNIFNWQKHSTELNIISDIKVSIYDIIFDENIMYLDNIEKSVDNFIELQTKSKNISIVGGVIDYTQEHFHEYLKSIISLFHNKQVQCTVINFIRSEMDIEKVYIVVSIFKRLMDMYPNKLAYSLYKIPSSLPIPTSYHIYDNKYIQFPMRRYVPQRGSMNAVSSFMIKSDKICSYYFNEIMENFKKLGKLDNYHYELFVQNLNLDGKKIISCDKIIEQYLQKERSYA